MAPSEEQMILLKSTVGRDNLKKLRIEESGSGTKFSQSM